MAGTGKLTQVLSHVARELGNDAWLQQIVTDSALLEKKVMPVVRSENAVHVLNIVSGVNSSSRALADGSSIGAANKSSVNPVQLRVRPQSFMSIARFGREAARVIGGDGSVDLVTQQMKAASETLSQTIGRAIINHIVGIITSSATFTSSNLIASDSLNADDGTPVQLTVSDYTGFREGSTYQLFNRTAGSSGVNPAFASTTAIATIKIVSVADNGTGTGIDGYVTALTSSAVTVGDGYCIAINGLDAENVDPLPGSSQSKRFVNLRLAAETNSNVLLYEASASASGSTSIASYVGNKSAVVSGEVENSLAKFATRIQTLSNAKMSHIIMHPLAYSEYENELVGQRRFMDNKYDQRADIQEVMPYFRNMPVILDRNCPADQIYVYGKDACDLLQFQDIGPDEEAGDALLLSRDAYTWEMQIVGMFNTKVKSRRTLGLMRQVFLGAVPANTY